MRKFTVLVVIVFAFACKSNQDVYKRKKVGDKFIETKFINDSTFDGLTKYYSLANVLESEIQFKNGIKNGYSKNYYPNGIVNDSMRFVNGLSEGYHFVYDSSGKLEYKDYYYHGRKVGGIFFYNNGKIVEYNFLSFDGKPLFIAKYDSLESVRLEGGPIINIQPTTNLIGSQKENVVFLYLINPPNISIEYSVGVYDSVMKTRKILNVIRPTQEMFTEFTPPAVGKMEGYYIQAKFTVNKYSRIEIKLFEF